MKGHTDSFKIAMLLKELYSKTINTVEDNFKQENLTHQQFITEKVLENILMNR